MNTQYISTTELREQSSKVVARLKLGEDMLLVHRSKVIGVIKPVTRDDKTITDISKFRKAIQALKPAKIIPRNKRESIYRKHLMEKYGKGIS